jgi:hypothetical protein
MSAFNCDEENKIPVGCVCLNEKSKIGIYTKYQGFGIGRRWFGIGVDGHIWASRQVPIIIANNAQEWKENANTSCYPPEEN